MLPMDQQKIAIATITWARDAAEEKLLKRSLLELATLDRPVYITDAGSPRSFIDFLHSIPQFHLGPAVKGVWPQVQRSLQKAVEAGHEHILYTEPDKLQFFSYLQLLFTGKTFAESPSPLIIFSRSAKAFSSFPSFQQMTETAINNCSAEVMGQEGDYTFGPFVVDANIFNHLHQLPADIGWGWRPFAFNLAKRLGYATHFIEGDFFCPADQPPDSPGERIYRMKQLQQNIQGLTLSVDTFIRRVDS
jgi:hypothetical protein